MTRITPLGPPLALIGVCATAAVVADYTSVATGIGLRAFAGVLAIAAAALGARHFGARPLRPWMVLASGLGMWVSADTIWDLLDLGHQPADSAWYLLPNVMYLLSYPALIAAVIALVAARGEGTHVARAVDSFIPALMLLLVLRAFLLDSHFTGDTTNNLFTALFPLCDALLIAGVAWLVYAEGLRNPAIWFLAVGLGTLLAADVIWDLYVRFGSAALSGIVGPIYPISYAIIAAAALHPGVARLTGGPRTSLNHDDSMPRLIMLCAALVLLPVIAYRGRSSDVLLMITAGALVLAIAVRFMRLVRDVRMERRLAELNAEQFAQLLGTAPVGIFAVDAEMTIIFANHATDTLLGRSAVGLRSRQLVELCVDKRDQPAIKQMLATMRSGEPAATQVRIWRPDVTQRWTSWYGTPVEDDAGRLAGAFVSTIDITAQKAAEEAVAHHLTHDPLTELATHRACMERLQVALRRLGRLSVGLAVLLVDVDAFSEVNRAYGFAAGDELLRVVAMRLRHCVRADDLVARLGADQFVIVLEHLCAPDDAAVVAGQVVDSLCAAMNLDRGRYTVGIGVSVGIVTTSDGELDAESLVRDAAKAMREAKSAGGRRYCRYTPAVIAARHTQQSAAIDEATRLRPSPRR